MLEAQTAEPLSDGTSNNLQFASATYPRYPEPNLVRTNFMSLQISYAALLSRTVLYLAKSFLPYSMTTCCHLSYVLIDHVNGTRFVHALHQALHCTVLKSIIPTFVGASVLCTIIAQRFRAIYPAS